MAATQDWKTGEKRMRKGEPRTLAFGPPKWERRFQCVLVAEQSVHVEGHTAGLAALKSTVLRTGHSGLGSIVL